MKCQPPRGEAGCDVAFKRVRPSEKATSAMGDRSGDAAEAGADRQLPHALRSTRVEREPIGLTEHGQRYRVTCAGGTLVEGRRNPIFDACRALLARGVTGRLEVWRRGRTSADMQLDMERGARLALCETATESLRVVPWQPRPNIIPPNVVSHRSVQSPAGKWPSPVGMPTPEPTANFDVDPVE